MGNGTGLGRVRGLGSAKHGSHHWVMQRFTAVGNLVLVPWLLLSLLYLPSMDYQTVVSWLSSPLPAVAMILLTISVFWHLRMGVQVMVEDYVHDHGLKFVTLVLLNFFVFGAAGLAIFSVAKIAFMGAA